MIREKPMRSPEWTKASDTEPDWAIPATPPRGSQGDTSPMYVALLATRSMTPMQFGPSRARPCSRAIRATSACIAAAAATALHDAAAGDDDRGHAGRGRRLGHGRGAQRVERDDRDVRPLGQGVEARVAGLAVELLVLRVDEVAARLAVHDPQVVAHRLGDPRARRRPDDGDAPWREQRPEVDDPGLVVWPAAHPTTRPTPRFSSARAMIIRWISEVPSQIRSTRSSRRNRSGANSRM